MGKRAGGWLATEIPSDDPSEDPAGDRERTDEYDPEVHIINGVLRTITATAAQAPSVIMEACDEDDEEEDDEEDEKATRRKGADVAKRQRQRASKTQQGNRNRGRGPRSPLPVLAPP